MAPTQTDMHRRHFVGAMGAGIVAALGAPAVAQEQSAASTAAERSTALKNPASAYPRPHLQPGAAIINATSVTACDPPPNLLDYAATKAAIMNFTKSLAKQLASRGIRVNAVAPDTPMGRPGQPAELAPIYVLLASGEASYATGQVYGAVGGRGGP
jgi:NAD(P)-dependent dehydrogenase (short-subunit alcohol dehydrogenase family)